jgi:pyruvate dehydrogenase complex dehydrogenase (E1) component
MALIPDNDPQETQEWLDALESVLENAHLWSGHTVQRDYAVLQHHSGG